MEKINVHPLLRLNSNSTKVNQDFSNVKVRTLSLLYKIGGNGNSKFLLPCLDLQSKVGANFGSGQLMRYRKTYMKTQSLLQEVYRSKGESSWGKT